MKSVARICVIFGLLVFGFSAMGAPAEKVHTKKELVAFVKKAVEYIKKNGKEAAFKTFSNKSETEFHQDELYIYVYDYKGLCLAHGMRPILIGKDGFEVKDPDGKYPNRLLAEKAKSEKTAFVQFKWSNPIHNKVENKLGYVEDVGGEFFVGSGIYPADLNP
jgi:cytochrome c